MERKGKRRVEARKGEKERESDREYEEMRRGGEGKRCEVTKKWRRNI